MLFTAKAWAGILTLGAIVIGGIGIKFLVAGQPYTLEYLDDFKEKGTYKDKFGGKFARFLLSHDEGHKEHNKSFWEANIRKLADEKIESGSYLNVAHNLSTTWNSESDSNNKKNKLEEAVSALISACQTKYQDTTVAEPSTESEKKYWKEIWTYCSVDGESHWPAKEA